jgi:hypothetical protein
MNIIGTLPNHISHWLFFMISNVTGTLCKRGAQDTVENKLIFTFFFVSNWTILTAAGWKFRGHCLFPCPQRTRIGIRSVMVLLVSATHFM